MTCFFCRKQGTVRRNVEKASTQTNLAWTFNGKAFWPKINMTETGNSAPIQALQHQDFQF